VLGDGAGVQIDNSFESKHPESDFNHSAIGSSDTGNLSEWIRNFSIALPKDLSIDPGASDYRHDHNSPLSNSMPGISHLNDYILPIH
jgi:hypothetical protein